MGVRVKLLLYKLTDCVPVALTILVRRIKTVAERQTIA